MIARNIRQFVPPSNRKRRSSIYSCRKQPQKGFLSVRFRTDGPCMGLFPSSHFSSLSRFSVRLENLLFRPDLALLLPRRATKGMGGAEPPAATRSARYSASMARMASTGPSPQ
jgi:hypothetical protein